MEAHDEEEVNLETWKSNIIPESNGSQEKNEAKSDESLQDLSRDWKMLQDHPMDQILGNTNDWIRTCSFLRNICANLMFLS